MTHDHTSADLRDQLAKTLHEAEDGQGCPYEAKHRETYEPLADAILALFDVDEQWGITWPPTGKVDWCDLSYNSEGYARANAKHRELLRPEVAGQVQVVRRWVLTTKPEEVTP
jgi:hypothetical protein